VRDRNPPMTPALRALTLAEVAALLLAGGALFFLPDSAAALWPWHLKPFNTLFLGSIYLAALAPVAVLLYYSRWSPARLVLPMLFVFTLSVLVVSIIYVGRFDLRLWSTGLWFAFYLVLPVNAAYHLWQYRDVRPPLLYPTSSAWRAVLLVAALALGLYGLAVLGWPESATAFWPWPVDGFHGRLYAAAFTTAATGAFGLAQFAAPVERLALGVSYTIMGLFAIFGVMIVDQRVHRVDWSAPGTQVWLGLFVAVFILGLLMIGWSSIQHEGAPA
jgi:hypothetical protein